MCISTPSPPRNHHGAYNAYVLVTLLPVVSFRYSGVFHNVVEMSSHDINTSVQLRFYSKLLSLDLFKPDNGVFDNRVSSSVHHNIEVSAHH